MKVLGTQSDRVLLALAALILSGAAAAQTDAPSLRAFRAVYGLHNGDKRIGEATFTLRYDRSKEQYLYESSSEFDGWLPRLAAPRPVVERSEFRLEAGRIRPLSYRYEDGTRRGRRNLHLVFRWRDSRVTVTRRDDSSEIPLPREALDRASVKIALGLAVREGRRAGRHEVADPDVFRAYEFASDANEPISTPLGELESYPVRQWRAESTRETIIWIAPALGYQPARIEQRRSDREPVAFALEAFEWLSPDGSAMPH